jgi:hypothetical protein
MLFSTVTIAPATGFENSYMNKLKADCSAVLRHSGPKGLQLPRLDAMKTGDEWEMLGLEKRVDLEHLRRVFDRLDTKGQLHCLSSAHYAPPYLK